jgi:peptide/nickel transport system permease protein
MTGDNVAATPEGIVKESKRRSSVVDLFIRLVREKPLGTVGAVIVLVLLLTGIFANFLAPYGINEGILADRLSPPSGAHLLGADNLGRDILSRIIYGARISVIIGLAATTIATLLSFIIGGFSGFIGGKLDMVVQRFVDAWLCLPPILILITVMSIVGTGVMQIIIVLGLLIGIGNSRVVRSATIAIKENTYIEAARSIGCSNTKILIQHILPNIMAPIIILFTISVGNVILIEASLSFLGFGLPPDVPSWGGMLSLEGRKYMELQPALALWPGLALSIVVYGVNMFGDALRDLLDPRLRGGLGRYTTRGMKKAGKRKVK